MATVTARKPNTMLKFFRREPDGTQSCFLIQIDGSSARVTKRAMQKKLRPFFEYLPEHEVTDRSTLPNSAIVGPRLTFETPFSSGAKDILRSAGFTGISRVEAFRYIPNPEKKDLNEAVKGTYDRVTECPYKRLPGTFMTQQKIDQAEIIPYLEQGIEAVKQYAQKMGLEFSDEQYAHMEEEIFRPIGCNPSDLTMLQLAQMWSNHSRHILYMHTNLIIDGIAIPETLFEKLRRPYDEIQKRDNNIEIAFADNASAIRGFEVPFLQPSRPGFPSNYRLGYVVLHITGSGETHNYPVHVAPYPGAQTEIGGEIRDQLTAGRGSDILFAGNGRVVGSLVFPNGYRIPGEFKRGKLYLYPEDKATPIEITLKSLQGWQDYVNCFGKSCPLGFFYSGAIWRPRRGKGGKIVFERIESLKPVAFGAGFGTIRGDLTQKDIPLPGMIIVQIGGSAYPVGFCGGSGSSNVSGTNLIAFDENAVQRGNAVMERLTYEVMLENLALGVDSPIAISHDQGAGGIANVLTELIERAGGRLYLGAVNRGDPTMSDAKVWICEYQERLGFVVYADKLHILKRICKRHRCPLEILGKITGDGLVRVYHERNQAQVKKNNSQPLVTLPLEAVLQKLPRVELRDETPEIIRLPLNIPPKLTLARALRNVSRRSEVGSKYWIIRGVDTSIGGLTILNQWSGPYDTPVNDCALYALSHFTNHGEAASFGVCPYLTSFDPQAGARMAVGEAVTNMMGIKKKFTNMAVLGNWMWPATINPPDGQVARLNMAVDAVENLLLELGIAEIGGKDSSSLATKVKDMLVVKSLETLVVSGIVDVPDVRRYLTPDIKHPGQSTLIHIDIARGKRRLGGSSFGQTLSQLGDDSPDVDDAALLIRAHDVVQQLMAADLITAGHDISSGGLLTTVIEMCFAAGCGINMKLGGRHSIFAEAFAEELGYVIECPLEHYAYIKQHLRDARMPFKILGPTTTDQKVTVKYRRETVLSASIWSLRREWERTGYELRKVRVNPVCAEQEWRATRVRPKPEYRLTFDPAPLPKLSTRTKKPRLAVIHEVGSNGHPEMIAAWHLAGFDVTDIHMSDIEDGLIKTLNPYQIIVFPGGFSHGDVFGAAVGWSLKILKNRRIKAIFDEFFARPDTLSLGICNGAQLGLRCGWAPLPDLAKSRHRPLFTQIPLGTFNHQWIRLKINESPSILLKGMAGSILGAWVANGEGYFNCDKNPAAFKRVIDEGLAPLVYVDPKGRETTALPYCPSGSFVAGVCDPTGHHSCFMPHMFDRGFDLRLWQHVPPEFKHLTVSPWMQMGHNAREWCLRH